MYHDSAASLCRDGDIVAAAAEERFIRRKHAVEFPRQSVLYCLKEGNLKINDLDCIVFYEKPFLKFERILKTHLMTYPFSYRSFKEFLPLWLSYKLYVPEMIREETGYQGKIIFCDHHHAHAASAFLPSPFKEAVILTVDGTGEWSTLSYGVGRNTNIRLERDIRFPHSLGLLYSAITAHLGFRVNWAEGTVMALAACGEPIFVKEFETLIDIKEDGSFRLNLDYFSFHYDLVMTNQKFSRLFSCPPRHPDAELKKIHRDIAATLQYVLEKIILRITTHLHDIYKIDSLCIAGGVGLNCIANGKILEFTPFKNIFVQPAAGDDGAALGAALYAYTHLFNGQKRWRMKTAYLGPGYSNNAIENFLNLRNAQYHYLPNDSLVQEVAKNIFANKVIGWFQGKMEFGPRALGSRSILANPCHAGVKEMLNEKVKHREGFRPYAPAVCLEDMETYFYLKQPGPFMTIAARVKEEAKAKIPGVVHVDGTARVQTVAKEDNPLFYDLLKAFEKISGVPIVVNTSFNLKGEPIVCSPEDAWQSFLETEMDFLVMGNFLIGKKENGKHENIP